MQVNTALYLGGLIPAPAALMAALDNVSVTQSDAVPNGFQMTFTTPRGGSELADFMTLTAGVLQAGQRVIVTASVDGGTEVLIDGYITRQHLQPPLGGAEGQVAVIGEDLSVLMDMHEVSLEFPYMPYSAIAALIIAERLLDGVIPQVAFSPTDLVNAFQVNQQVGTDRSYLSYLAQLSGYVFCIRPGPVVGTSRAYWGPPLRDAPPQPVLTVDASGFGDVTSLSVAFDATAPTVIYGSVQNELTGGPLPVGAFFSTRPGRLSANPPLGDIGAPSITIGGGSGGGGESMSGLISGLASMVGSAISEMGSVVSSVANMLETGGRFQQMRFFDHSGLNPFQAETRAQALVDVSTDRVVTLNGQLDVLRHGAILVAPGVVGIRGIGGSFDGYYYVQKVVNSISRGAYVQSFTLARDGLSSTIGAVPASQLGSWT